MFRSRLRLMIRRSATDAGDIDRLWLRALEDVVNRGAHEIKDVVNGVSLNLEVVRSRLRRIDPDPATLSPFAATAMDQLEILTARLEALLFLGRPARDPADVALVLKHLAALLVPAENAAGRVLIVDGYEQPALTAAPAQITRFAVASALLAQLDAGGQGAARCTLEPGPETVVRFSHESAEARSLEPAVADAIAGYNIRQQRSATDLTLVFPGS